MELQGKHTVRTGTGANQNLMVTSSGHCKVVAFLETAREKDI